MAARLKQRSKLWSTGEKKATKRATRNQESRLTTTTIDQDEKPPVVDFCRLPVHIWLQVMEQLSLEDRYHMALTCKLFHQLLLDPSLWRSGSLSLDLIIEEGDQKLGLKKRDKTRAETFGRFFKYLDLTVSATHVDVDDGTLALLSHLSKTWTLKGLKLSAPSFGVVDPKQLKTSKKSGLYAAVEIIKGASSLQELDLRQWPVTSDALSEEDSELGIDRMLTKAQTCPELKSLNIMWKKPIRLDAAENVVKRSPQTAVNFVTKCPHLQHVSLYHFLLSESLLKQLASNAAKHSPLQSLSVSVRYDSDPLYNVTPRLSKAAWVRLKAACPQLQVRLVVRSRDVQFIEWILQPHIPVSSVSLHILLALLPLREIVARTTVWTDTLKSLHVDVLDEESFSLDEDLLDVVTSCPQLVHLVFHGKIRSDTISRLASLPRKWTAFTFCEDDIQPGLNDTELSPFDDVRQNQRRRLIYTLCASVSRDLGYQWRPSSRDLVTSLL
ncbi:uncharacterized protein [Littorina saxatilis]|uniref:F-box domain-containing protein n=1 Tax=Littorina saxatilis TaxID=31220 RepID=A0AAN9B5G0_9CAEN